MPPGFPKGQTAYTTAKVIAARSFLPPPARASPSSRSIPRSRSTAPTSPGSRPGTTGRKCPSAAVEPRSGVAPRAYLGNYRVLTVPTVSNVGLDGNSPEIAAAIEAAVQDGMDVINLSIGEPEIPPSRDLVVRAIDGAAAAGVVSTVSAGNDFEAFGRGSVSSPGSAASAITVGRDHGQPAAGGFSSAGPTPLSLRLKPEVAAPGVEILSAAPNRRGQWQSLSGTSMAAPHVAGAAAVLLQRHPTWTPAQVKSALVTTGRGPRDPRMTASTTREGGGFVDLVRADRPCSSPRRRRSRSDSWRAAGWRRSELASRTRRRRGQWAVSHVLLGRRGASGSRLPRASRCPARSRSGCRHRRLPAPRRSPATSCSRAGETRQIPFWSRVTARLLARHSARPLTRTGTYRGNTRGRRALVSVYRYPENPTGSGVPGSCAAPSSSSACACAGRPRTSAWRSSSGDAACASSRESCSPATRTGRPARRPCR